MLLTEQHLIYRQAHFTHVSCGQWVLSLPLASDLFAYVCTKTYCLINSVRKQYKAEWCRTHPVSPPNAWLLSKQKVPGCPAQGSVLHCLGASAEVLRPQEVAVFPLFLLQFRVSEAIWVALQHTVLMFFSMELRVLSYAIYYNIL